MSIAELTEESTSEEISAHVEQVVQEVKEERAGETPEKKGDAQIASEHASTKQPADNETPPAETNSGSETADVDTDESETTAEVEDQGEESGREWFDDDLKAEIAAYGIDEK